MQSRKYLYYSLFFLLPLIALSTSGCTADPKPEQKEPKEQTQTQAKPPKVQVNIPAFNADSAYAYIEKQVSFGPRVMGSKGHQACQDWLVQQFKSFGAKVTEQTFTANVYTGKSFPAANIIAEFNPAATDRILLGAHWDTRHVADSPINTERVEEPILGADDGGSGVGVLLEIARQLQAQKVNIGIDIVLFDAEDYGESGGTQEDTYCLGSQYWSKNMHNASKARYGVLLDMVGAKDAKFVVEQYSYQYAQPVVDKVWGLAMQMKRTKHFKNQLLNGGITDDHYYVNTIAGVPMADIINLNGQEGRAFGNHWHTHNDDMSIIDKGTLNDVGQVLLALIYREDAGAF